MYEIVPFEKDILFGNYILQVPSVGFSPALVPRLPKNRLGLWEERDWVILVATLS